MSEEMEWRIKIKVVGPKGEELIDQPLNEFPLQGMPTELAINVGSLEERQVIKPWHYFEVKIYLKSRMEAIDALTSRGTSEELKEISLREQPKEDTEETPFVEP